MDWPDMDWNLIGHRWAVQLLQHHIRSRQVRHAYLFAGPRGVGRRTLALRFAQALTCLQPPAPAVPCRACASCQRWERMQHPDLTVVQAEREGGTLKVDQVREMQRTLSLTPHQAAYRIALLLRFEEAHPAAANALLKTLEEPPPHVILLLTAESPEQLLPTITSRCEVVRLRPPAVETTAQGLAQLYGVPLEKARLLAHLAAGRPGLALRMQRQPELVENRRRWVEDFFHLLHASVIDRFAYVDRLYKDPVEAREALLTWLSLWRDVLVQSSGSQAPVLNVDHRQALEQVSLALGWEPAYAILSRHERTLNDLDKNANLRLALENLLLHWPHL